MRLARTSLLSAAFLVLALHAQGAPLFDSITGATSDGNFTAGVGDAGSVGASFAIPAASSVTLTDIKVALSGNSTDGGSFMLFLVQDDGTDLPAFGGTKLATQTFSDSVLSGSIASIDFSNVAGVALAAGGNTQYWVVLEQSGEVVTSATWEYTANLTGTGVGSQFLEVGGSSGSNSDFGSAMEMAVAGDVSTTPEPSSLAVLGVGILGLVAVIRRKRRAG